MLKTKPNDPGGRMSRAMANFRLGENQKALDDLKFVIGKDPQAVSARQYRAIALARLGKKQEARTDLAKLQKVDATEHSRLYLAAVVAAELGEGADKAFEALEAALGNEPRMPTCATTPPVPFRWPRRPSPGSDRAKGRQHAERSLQLLREAVKNDDADFGRMDDGRRPRPDPGRPGVRRDPEGRPPGPPLCGRLERRRDLRGDARSTVSIPPTTCGNAGS